MRKIKKSLGDLIFLYEKKPSVGENIYANFFLNLATLNFLVFFASHQIVNIERKFRCKTDVCNNSRTSLILLPML